MAAYTMLSCTKLCKHFSNSAFNSLRYSLRKCSTNRVSIKELYNNCLIGKKIYITGWIRAFRKQKENLFMEISDGSTYRRLQVVCASSAVPKDLSVGCALELFGLLVESTHPKQPFELKPDTINISGHCDKLNYPFQPKSKLTLEHIRAFPHLRARTRVFGQILRIRSSATMAVHDVFQNLGFFNIHTPILTSNDCEGAGEAFIINSSSHNVPSEGSKESKQFFDKNVFLTVSGQFHLEAMASALTNVYTLGPTFRAENSRTRHHLSEFYMIEAEMAFMSSLDDLTKFIEMFLKRLIKNLMDKCSEEIAILHDYLDVKTDVSKLIDVKYERMTYDDAICTINKLSGISQIKWGQDLLKEHEKKLVEACGNVPLFITNFPAHLKPFYMQPSDINSKTVDAVDLIVPEVGELCGGSIREHRYDEIKQKIEELKLNDSLQWYLDLRTFGTCQHAGFGMGFERFLQLILKVPNIKDTIPFPRWTHNCEM